jgi:hypothetical protein
MKFYLGTHMPHWLGDTTVPLFVSHRRLKRYKKLPTAAHNWALDSGGFTELGMHGKWQTTTDEYIDAVHRYNEQIGSMDWAAPQDWMCEPHMIERTGLSVEKHQHLTTDNYLTLKQRAGTLPFIPVLQGWTLLDYLHHIDIYQQAGVDLTELPIVGIGSVCRRQYTDEIGAIVGTIAAAGIKLHGFGVKSAGLLKYGQHLASADSMAWSFGGRYISPCPHTGVKTCANCRQHAMEWRDKAIERYPTRIVVAETADGREITVPTGVWGSESVVRWAPYARIEAGVTEFTSG